jgi:three-Cys-motif partner protein
MRHQFGGDWTTQKLEVLAGYLKSYNSALKNKPSPENPFRRSFIDAFAGTGYRDLCHEGEELNQAMFPDLASAEPQALLDGSARLALQVVPPFDDYVFIEKKAERCAELEKLKDSFPNLAAKIDIRHGEANEQIQQMCATNWRARRAVLFLDPYGMQVEWKTIEAIASTKAIDLWLLFPLGMGVNRLLLRTGDIPASWRKRLDLLLGTSDWYEEFYRKESMPTLFGDEAEHLVKVTTETIGKYFNNRLKEVFAGVAENPGVLRNSTNNPLYLLCFAVSNERGKPMALRIAEHLLKGMR